MTLFYICVLTLGLTLRFNLASKLNLSDLPFEDNVNVNRVFITAFTVLKEIGELCMY